MYAYAMPTELSVHLLGSRTISGLMAGALGALRRRGALTLDISAVSPRAELLLLQEEPDEFHRRRKT